MGLINLGETIVALRTEVDRFRSERDQYKAERDTLIDDLSWYKAKVSRLERENEDMLLEREYYKNRYRDTIRICKELERGNEKLKEENKDITIAKDRFVKGCYLRNKEILKIKEEKEEFHHKLMAQLEVNTELRMSNKDKHAILSEISQHIGNKPSSSTYKYFRAKLDGIGVKEGE